jgi:glutathione S-transferase
MALAHKGLEVQTHPWRFTEKDAIGFSGQGLVPVIIDGERTLHDSWAIAEYLDAHYPDRPALFGSDEARALAFFFKQWARVVSPIRLLEPDDPVYAWRERMLDLYEGLARNAPGHPVWA